MQQLSPLTKLATGCETIKKNANITKTLSSISQILVYWNAKPKDHDYVAESLQAKDKETIKVLCSENIEFKPKEKKIKNKIF